MDALRRARRKRKWSLTRASREIGISEQQLRNLEGIGATRATDPGNIRVKTLVKILEAYPSVDLDDFVPTRIRVRRRKASS